MLKIFCSSYPYFSIISWTHFLSFSTVSTLDDAASPCLFTSFNPFLSLNRVNQPSLKFNFSSLGIPTNFANMFHFWQSNSLVSKNLSFIAFETQRSIISETSGCSIWQTRLAFRSYWLSAWAHCSCHSASNLNQDEINGCLIQRLG